MLVSEMMTREVQTCNAGDSLNTAAEMMWRTDCGCLPVVDDDGKTIAMITDRDICMAAYTQGRQLVAMSVASAASNNIVTVRGDESVAAAEALMRKHQIRRIPVVDANGRPTGIVSMNDLARHGEHAQHGKHAKHDGLDAEMILHTLAAVSNPSKHEFAG